MATAVSTATACAAAATAATVTAAAIIVSRCRPAAYIDINIGETASSDLGADPGSVVQQPDIGVDHRRTTSTNGRVGHTAIADLRIKDLIASPDPDIDKTGAAGIALSEGNECLVVLSTNNTEQGARLRWKRHARKQRNRKKSNLRKIHNATPLSTTCRQRIMHQNNLKSHQHVGKSFCLFDCYN